MTINVIDPPFLTVFLENQNITLRALEPEDLEVLYKWENDTTFWFTGNTVAPYSRYDLKQYIATAPKDVYEQGFIKLLIERKSDGARIGVVDIFDYNPHHQRAEIGLYIDASYRGQGYGLQAVRLASSYALSFLHLNQLYCHIPFGNDESEALFTKAGYKKTAVMPQWIKGNDGFTDVIFMTLLSNPM